MRIIKRGAIPEMKELKTKCRSCNTEFAFLPLEAKLHFDQRDGDFYAIACPVCKAQVTVQK